ncbi:PI-PLC X domain-containing protein 1 [Cephus cinctus]|uniref:PI-PLC X domain-containing protein 1 n=1 Tax=Cephus cinctus TaxID=211228 RepID=A0AAJ7RGN1_CEPCN|nr:PI-PLC X domain-containing protein 1 [Cephus cinctus]XP_024940171.1 PI-PLC X domain-containing protein 1 [Cephus cinctus]XP_024940172.1 PI-PLC X domain-containing protein 1 [Cephus cinctus]
MKFLYSYYILTIATLLIVVRCSASKSCSRNSTDEFANSHVGLIISPMLSSSEIRRIEIYWTHANLQSGDVIALYDEEPREVATALYSFEPHTINGILKTRLQADFVPTSNLTFERQCLKYHVAWLRNGVIRKTNCLETRPNWLAQRKSTLGSARIRDLFLPGTHDSVSYSIVQSPTNDNIIDKYVIAQDEDVLAQLIYGIRYLDIRVGYYPLLNQVWWGNHGIVNVVPLQTIINDLKIFLNNTEEIVIFDVQEFPIGFGSDLSIHHKLVAYLEKQLGDYLLPKSYGWSTTLDNIWASGKRLIIGYDQSSVVPLYNSIWPCVTHQWGNVRSVSALYTYLNRIETAAMSSLVVNPRSAMAQMTPNTWDVILDRLGGLRKMANDVNINVTTWYATKWHNSANIVAVDFFKGSGIIETSIEWNDKRFSSC